MKPVIILLATIIAAVIAYHLGIIATAVAVGFWVLIYKNPEWWPGTRKSNDYWLLALVIIICFGVMIDTVANTDYGANKTTYEVIKTDTLGTNCIEGKYWIRTSVCVHSDAEGYGNIWDSGTSCHFVTKDTTTAECTAAHVLRLAKENENKRIREENIAKAWRTVKTYQYVNGEGYVVIQKNDSTGEYRDKNNGEGIMYTELTWAAENKYLPLYRSITKDSVLIRFGDGQRKFVGVGPAAVDMKSVRDDVCRKKTSIAGKLVYVEYEACVKTAETEHVSFQDKAECQSKVPVRFWYNSGIDISVYDQDRTGCHVDYDMMSQAQRGGRFSRFMRRL